MTGLSAARIYAVLVKEFRQLTRDRLTFAVMLVIPIMQLVLFGYSINFQPRRLPTAVLAQEDSRFARAIVAALQNSRYFELTRQVRSPAELDALVRRGEVQFAVTIPGDFTRRVARGDDAQVLVEVDASDPAATGPALAALEALGLPRAAAERSLRKVLREHPGIQSAEELIRLALREHGG